MSRRPSSRCTYEYLFTVCFVGDLFDNAIEIPSWIFRVPPCYGQKVARFRKWLMTSDTNCQIQVAA